MSLTLLMSLQVREGLESSRGWVLTRVGEGHCAWCSRSHPKDCVGSMDDILMELLLHRKPKALQQYLRKVRGGLLCLTAWC